MSHLSHVPVRFGEFNTVTSSGTQISTKHKIPCFAQQIPRFSWAVYSFSGGHFASMVTSHNLSFCVKIVCNQYESGRALFCEFMMCNRIFSNGNKTMDCIHSSGDTSQVHGYLIHSLWFTDSDTTGISKEPSFPNWVHCVTFMWLWLSSCLIMMVNESNLLSKPSSPTAGRL
jgi:hypothetical protein